MNADKKIKLLKQLLYFRDIERQSRMEFNGYSEQDDAEWCKDDELISEEIRELSEGNCCSASELTLDEAIQHASDVASKSDTPCAKNHKQLADWLTELKDIKTKFQYLAADFDNFKKRSSAERSLAIDSAKKKIFLELLSVVDDMDRLMETVRFNENLDQVSDTDAGFEMIRENLLKMLNANGCTKIDCEEGDAFDVNLHEAVSVQKLKDSDKSLFADYSICKVLQTGWLLDEKLLRAARVVVYQA